MHQHIAEGGQEQLDGRPVIADSMVQTGDAVLGETRNTANCDAAFDSLLEFVVAQQEENSRATNAMVSKYEKYLPNRAQRRSVASNAKKYKPADR